MQTGITFVCKECKNENYRSTKNKKNITNKINIKKYCKKCRSHVLHNEKK